MKPPYELPRALEIRSATPADAQAVLHLRQAEEMAEGDVPYTTEERMAVEWEALGSQLGAQVLVVESLQQGMEACADLARVEGEFMVRLWATGHRPGLAEALLMRLERQACALGKTEDAKAVTLFAQATAAQPANQWALLDRYFEVSSTYEKMEFALTEPPSPPSPITNIMIRQFAVGDDEEAIYHADEEAFLDQRGHTSRTFAQWSQRLRQSVGPPDPALWLIAWDGEVVAGAALCEVIADIGWIHHLFVRRPWRRFGLGEALTRSALVALHRRGVAVARLNVDGQSLTNAHELYRKVGFRVIGGYTNYQKLMPLP